MFDVLCMLGVQACVHAQGVGVDVHGVADGLKALVEAGLAKAAGLLPYPTHVGYCLGQLQLVVSISVVPCSQSRTLQAALQPLVTPCDSLCNSSAVQ